jgi:branched-chain amino acid transport system ATP-binding protein
MLADATLLRVSGLGKRFSGVQAVDDVSFTVRSGEILGLIGPNGAGKTTTFNLISGLFPASSGQVELAGRLLTGLRADQVAACGLSRTFQGTRTFPKLTVAENLRIPFLARSKVGFWRSWLRIGAGRTLDAAVDLRVAEILAFTGLAPYADVVADSMPYARQSLLGIGMALAGEPLLLLLDEPFAGMNPGETAEAAAMVRRIRDTGVTVLLVEHDMPAVMGICDRIVVLDGGRKLIEGTPDEVRQDPQVITAYLGTDDA